MSNKIVVKIIPISHFRYFDGGKERTEVECYADGTKATVVAIYTKRQ